MSNRVTIQTTEFKNVPQGTISFGVRIYDDYGQTYDNNWENIPKGDLEILQQCLENCNEISGTMFDFIQENETGIYINQTWYEWDEIKHLWENKE